MLARKVLPIGIALAATAVCTTVLNGQDLPLPSVLPQPFAGVSFSPAETRRLHRAEDLLVRDCMRGKGSDFAPTGQTGGSTPNPYGLLRRSDAEAHGYDSASPPLAKEPSNADDAALFGTPEHEVEVALPGGGHLTERTDGCFYATQVQLYGPDWPTLKFLLESLSEHVVATVQQDQRFTVAQAKWAGCMREHGYQATTLAAIQPGAEQYIATVHTDEARREVHDVAVRDATCQEKSRIAVVVQDLQTKAEQAVGHRDELARIGEIRSRALAQAEQLAP